MGQEEKRKGEPLSRPCGHRGAALPFPNLLASSSSLGFWGQGVGRGTVPGPAWSAHCSLPSPAFAGRLALGNLQDLSFPNCKMGPQHLFLGCLGDE